SPKMQEIFSLITKVADSDATILITGESGTGKELIAKTIHYMSYRSKYPFVPINCGAIPKELLESEFFGYEKGAFTGAVATKKGRVELADKGTLFLDEIGELLLPLQVKLLRFIQEREFERVGGGKTLKVDVRIISATNRDLEKDVLEGKFREDLFYRLNVIPIHIPPLRERKEDIPLLLNHFLAKFCKKRKRQILTISKDAMRCLENYHWPGNIRELENLCDRLSVLVSGNKVEIYDLPEKILGNQKDLYQPSKTLDVTAGDFVFPENGFDLNKVLNDFERKAIIEALKRTNGVKSKAASLLGLNRTTLIEKMKKMKIPFDTGLPVEV
ncbi:MAG: sigma-54 dependent transcriptional regulator, partial [Thermodesulfovibrio sp.]|nr:sigma-54 dependent transcriptional regulator [Thermodesulfovibrio sp.]